jgi:hypothetical protein
MGIFELNAAKKVQPDETQQPAHVTNVDLREHFRSEGFSQARDMQGAIECLKVCLNRVYREHVTFVKKERKQHSEGQQIEEDRIERLKGLIKGENARHTRIKEEQIPHCESNIERLKEEQIDIREHPEQVTESAPSKASFIIGTIILSALTLYLGVFYTSASYSAFFKQFTEAEIAVSNSIFDAQAVTKAYGDGATELIFILLTPFIFLGLGFLIHKFEKTSGFEKFAKVGALISFTFLFDALLAFEITEKIAFIKSVSAFESGFEYGVKDAAVNPVFWLIIFAGFIVYIIWGVVFGFVMEEHESRDVIRNALRAKKELIAEEYSKISNYREELENIRREIDQHEAEKLQLDRRLARTTFVTKEFELKIDLFLEGWLAWTTGNRMSDLNNDLISYRNNFVRGLGTFEDVSSAQKMTQ